MYNKERISPQKRITLNYIDFVSQKVQHEPHNISKVVNTLLSRFIVVLVRVPIQTLVQLFIRPLTKLRQSRYPLEVRSLRIAAHALHEVESSPSVFLHDIYNRPCTI